MGVQLQYARYYIVPPAVPVRGRDVTTADEEELRCVVLECCGAYCCWPLGWLECLAFFTAAGPDVAVGVAVSGATGDGDGATTRFF
jgi:hypothetical protein